MLGYDPGGFRKAEAAFPIRVKVRPSFEDIQEALAQTSHWLSDDPNNPDHRRYGLILTPSWAILCFRQPNDASRFLSEFPGLVLEGETLENAADRFGNADLDQLFGKEHGMADVTDFDSMTRAELVELRGKLDKAISAAGDRDRQRALKAAEDLAREHGFSLAELTGGGSGKGRGAGGKRSGRATAPALSDAKYRNPENAEQTWSGRGRRPGWVNEALANGRALTDLAI